MKSRLITISILVGCLLFIFSTLGTLISLWKAGDKVALTQAQVALLEATNSTLKNELQKTQEPGFVEKSAREKLNMSFPGESIVIISQSLLTTPPKLVFASLPNWKKWLNLFF